MIIVPALVSILEELRRSAEAGSITDFEDKRWYRVVANKLKSLGIDLSNPNSFNDSSVLIAQKLIGNPLEESLLVLSQYESTED